MNAEIKAFLDCIPAPCLMLDEAFGTIIEINTSFANHYDSSEQSIGKSPLLWFSEKFEGLPANWLNQLKDGLVATVDNTACLKFTGRWNDQKKHGKRHTYEIRCSSYAKEVQAYLLMLIDVGPVEAENEHATELLQKAEALARFGNWDLDLTNGKLRWSDGVFRMLGYEPQEFELNQERGAAVIYPDDLERAIEAMQNSLATGAEYRVQKRLIAKDGSIRHVISSADISYDTEGNPIQMYGVFQDISEHISIQSQLIEKKELTDKLIENLTTSFFLVSPEGQLLRWNKHVGDISGYTEEEIKRMNAFDFFPAEEHLLVQEKINEVFQNGSTRVELHMLTKSGQKLNHFFSATRITYQGQWCLMGTAFNQHATKEVLNELNLMLDNTREAFILMDEELKIVTFNLQFEKLYKTYFGISVAKGSSILDYAQPERRHIAAKIYEDVLAGQEHRDEITIPFDGKLIITEIHYTPVRNEKQAIIGAFVATRDITEMRAREAEIEERNQELKRVFEQSIDIICTIDPEGRFVSTSPICEHIWGYTPEELKGRRFIELVHPEDVDKTSKEAESILDGALVINFNNRYIHKQGRVVYMSWSARFDQEQQLLYCIARDSSVQKEANEQLAATEARYKLLFDVSPICKWIYDINSLEILDVNAAVLKQFGYSRDEILQMTIRELRPAEEIPVMLEANHNLKENAEHIQKGIYKYCNKSGDTFLMDIHGNTMYFQGRNAVLVESQDVTLRQQALSALRRSEARYRGLNESQTNYVIRTDLAGCYTYVNRKFEEDFGWLHPNEDILGLSCTSSIMPYELERVTETVHACIARPGEVIKIEIDKPRKDGGIITSLWDFMAITDADNNALELQCVGIDISERIQIEKALRSANERFEYATEAVSEAVWDWNLKDDSLYLGKSFDRLFGYELNERIMPVNFWSDLIHKEDREAVLKSLDDLLAGTGNQWEGQYRYLRADGSFAYVQDRGLVLRNDSGKAYRMVGALQDITSTIETEQQANMEKALLENSMRTDADFKDVISQYLQSLETLIPGMLASIQWLKNDCIYHLAAPNLPKGLTETIEGITIGPQAGSCGTAAYHKKTVIVCDIARDELWKDFKQLANTHGMKACWSHPIFNSKGQVIAVFDNYFRETRSPQTHETQKIERAVRMLSLVLGKYKIDQEILHTNERFEYVNKATNDVIFEWNILKDEAYLAPSFKRIFKHYFGETDLNWQSFQALIHHDDVTEIIEDLEKSLADPHCTHWSKQYRIRKANGEFVWTEEDAYILRNEQGVAEKMIGVIRDIHLRKEEDLQLRLLEMVVTKSSDAVLISDGGDEQVISRVLYANKAFLKLTGFKRNEVIGAALPLLKGPKTDSEAYREFQAAIQAKKPALVDAISYRKNGEEFWLQVSATPIFDEAGQLTHWVSIERDITEEKIGELKTALLATISAAFSNEADQGIAIQSTLDAVQKFATALLVELWLPDNQHTQIHLHTQIIHQGTAAFDPKNPNHSFQKGKGLPGICWEKRNLIFWPNLQIEPAFIRQVLAKSMDLVSAYGIPLITNNEFIGVLLIAVDREENSLRLYKKLFEEIGRHFAIELKRKQLERDLKQIFDTSPDLICLANFEGYFTKVNPAVMQVLGYTEAELLSNPFNYFIHPDDLVNTNAEMKHLYGGGLTYAFENRYRHKNGHYIWLSWSSTPYPNEQFIIAIAKDVTLKKQAEASLVYQKQLIDALARFNELLLDQEKFESQATNCLRLAGEACGADRVYFFENQSDVLTKAIFSSQRFEWSAPGIEPHINDPDLQYKSFESFGPELQPVLQGQSVQELTNSLADEAFRELNKAHQTQSYLVSPVMIDGICAGFIGFDDCKSARRWSDEDVKFQMGMASGFAAALQNNTNYHSAKYKTKLLETNTRIVEKLLSSDDWKLALNESLAIMGTAVAVDRAYYLETFKAAGADALYVRLTMEWTNGLVTEELSNEKYQAIRLDDFPEVRDPLLRGEPFSIFTRDTNGELYDILAEQDIVSILHVPVILEGVLMGYIGFDDCHKERIWTEEEEMFLKTLASNLGMAMQRKQQLDALREAYEKRNIILESIDDGFFTLTPSFEVTYWNNKAEQLLHTPKERVLGKVLWEVFDPSRTQSFHKYTEALNSSEAVHFEDYYEPIDSWFEVSAYPSSEGLSVYFKDVTAQVKQAIAIKTTNERFEKVVAATRDGIWDWDIVKNEVYTSEVYRSLFGYPLDEPFDYAVWLSRIHPDDRQNTEAKVQEVLVPGSQVLNFVNEYRFLKANGEYAYLIDRGMVVQNENGEPIRLIGALSDISEQKQYEASLRELNKNLEERAKELAISNAELEQFAFVASHDLQEPLRMITSFLSQLEKKYSHILDEKGLRYIHFAVDGGRKMRQIILDLLEFSRVGRFEEDQESIVLSEVVSEVLSLNRRLLEETEAKVEVQALPVVKQYRYPVQQIIQNLLNNAVKYRHPERKPEITMGSIDGGDHYEIFVRDNGQGIHPDYFDKIFIIFQRLHHGEAYTGTGMGLAIVKKIVDHLGEQVRVESTPGEGSCFYFTLRKT
ncbi:MAG: PAS domain S-box protein [Bacteroidia bacterium]